eukprot:gene25751-biopygen15058
MTYGHREFAQSEGGGGGSAARALGAAIAAASSRVPLRMDRNICGRPDVELESREKRRRTRTGRWPDAGCTMEFKEKSTYLARGIAAPQKAFGCGGGVVA